MTDLPPGNWSSYLVGAWWPAPPNEPNSGVQYWSDQSSAKEREAIELQAFTDGVSARNSGQTTEDELMRLRTGYNRLANASEHCRSKSTASRSVANAVDELRRQLTNIADRYNPQIDELVAKNTPEAMAEAIGLIATANTEAAEHSSEANGKIIAATQQMFNELGIEGDAQRWLQDNGAKFGPPPSQLPSSEELSRTAAGTDQLPFPYGAGDSGNHTVPKSVEELLLPGGSSTGGGNNFTPSRNGGNDVATGGDAVAIGGNSGGDNSNGGGTIGGNSGADNIGRDTGAIGNNLGNVPQGAGAPSPVLPPAAPGGIPAATAMGAPGGVPSPAPSAMPALTGPPSGGGMPPGLNASGPTQALAAGMPGGAPGPGGTPPPLPPGGAGPGGFGQPSQIPPSPAVTPMAGGALGNMAQLASSNTEIAPPAPTAGATPAAPPAPPVAASPASVSSGRSAPARQSRQVPCPAMGQICAQPSQPSQPSRPRPRRLPDLRVRLPRPHPAATRPRRPGDQRWPRPVIVPRRASPRPAANPAHR